MEIGDKASQIPGSPGIRALIPKYPNILRGLFLIALAFTLLSSSSFCEPEIAITVNGDNIYKDEFDHALSRYEDSYRKYFGENIDAAVREKIKKELTDDLINRQLYVQEAKRRGITAKAFAGEEEIEEILLSGSIASPESKEARDRAEQIVLGYKMRDIIPSKVIAAIKEDINKSDREFLDEYRSRAEEMKVKYIKVDPVPMANNMEISEDEIRSYYRSRGERFRIPSSKTYAILYFDPYEYIGMVSITPKMISDYYKDQPDEFRSDKLASVKYVLFRIKDFTNQIYDVGVNLRKYYEDNLDKFVEPAQARIKLISMKKPCSWKRLRGLEDELKQGVPFQELAAKYSDDPSAQNGGDLGYIKKGTLKEPYNNIAFGLANGQASGVIETDNSYFVVSVEDNTEAHIAPFDEVRDKIEEQLLNEAAKPLAMAEAKKFKLEAKKEGFEKAAMKKGLTVFETDYFSESDRIPTIGRNLLFTSTALGLSSGEVSNEIEYDGGFAVLEVVGIKPPENLPLSDVSGRIESKIMGEDSLLYAENAAKHALNLVSEGVALKDLENRMSVHITTVEVSSTYETLSQVGEIVKKNDGYYVTLLITQEPSYIPDFDQISEEAAAKVAMEKAENTAWETANKLYAAGAVKSDKAAETPPFSRNDYVIDGEYMRPFVEQNYMLKVGQAAVIKSMGKYYVVMVVERGVNLPGYKDESAVIESQVLKEKRAEYSDDWLKKERDKARVQVNI